MRVTVEPGKIEGNIAAPPSKSLMQRLCAAALLHCGKTIIKNPGTSNDDKAALSIVTQLGGHVEKKDGYIEIRSEGLRQGILQPIASEIECGESGLSARLFLPIVSLARESLLVKGKGSLLQRPMKLLIELLPELGVEIRSENNQLPVRVRGPLRPQNITIDGSVSSQFLTGLLFAYGFAVNGEPKYIAVHDLKSRPYIDLTIEVLKQFHVSITNKDYRVFRVEGIKEQITDIVCEVEGDWSNAAFWLVAAALNGEVSVEQLNLSSSQADLHILEALQDAGAGVKINQTGVSVSAAPLGAFTFDATDAPDLFPVLAILASLCEGESRIGGLHRLKHKESDRKHSIENMLKQFGVPFTIEGDTLHVTGIKSLRSAVVSSFNDHRIAMAAAIGALRAEGPVVIEQADAVSKSYPAFFRHLSSLGIQCSSKS